MTEPEEGERDTALTPSWSATRILVVQRDDIVRRAVVRALERYGYLVHDASNMDDAVEHARKGARIDVVLSEFAKDEISGPELVLRLRRFVPMVRAIFIGASGAQVRARARKTGTLTLCVPFGLGELLTALRELAGGFPN